MKYLIFSLAALLFAGPLAGAQQGGIGFVDMERAMENAPLYAALVEERRGRVNAIEQTIGELEGILDTKMRAYQQAQLTGSAAALKRQEDEIKKLQRDLESFQNSAQTDITRWTSEQKGRLTQQIRAEIEKMRAERGLLAVLSADAAIAIAPSADLTVDIIQRLGGSAE